ncbi:MAG TPA: ATP-binding protein [Opitutaceae bacterium]|nr:ATP-binding protein [Opitutaceae bacterium]
MTGLLAAGLALALLVAVFKLRQHRRALRGLEQSITERQPYLREEAADHLGADWDRLCEAASALTGEVNRLQQFRTSQLAQLEATLGSLQEAVLIVDHTNHILLANRALQGIFPSATDIMGSRVELVLQSREFLDYVEALRAGRAVPRQTIEFAKGSDSVWAEVTGSLIPPLDGQDYQWALFVLHDISHQRKLEAVRRDFVANVSHELRTPLSVIKGYIETLVDGHHDMPAGDRERFLRTIQRHTERLNSLLEDLLTLSRLESVNPGLQRETVPFAKIIAEVAEDYRTRPAAGDRRVDCTVDPATGSLWIDASKITQVLENLLDNALKYTPKGAVITVSAEPRAGEVVVCVRDNGPGIPPEDQPHIFERFYRVDKGRSREKGGTGLGLSIVKHIVQLHGGRVWVESQLGQGTAFYFSLPRREAK